VADWLTHLWVDCQSYNNTVRDVQLRHLRWWWWWWWWRRRWWWQHKLLWATRKSKWLIAIFTCGPELCGLQAYQPLFTRLKLRRQIIISIIYMNRSNTFIAVDCQDQCQYSVIHTCSSLTTRFSNLYSSIVNVFLVGITLFFDR